MRLVCITGRSASGKDRIAQQLELFGYNVIVSYTTKEPGIGEVNGRDYHFVTKKDFKRIVDKQMVMEWAEYDGNYYGSPRPIGSINNVVVVEPDGYESIKKLYGKQAIGVYIDVDDKTAEERALKRGREPEDKIKEKIEARKIVDNKKFENIENKVDLVVDGRKDIRTITAEILKYISDNNL